MVSTLVSICSDCQCEPEPDEVRSYFLLLVLKQQGGGVKLNFLGDRMIIPKSTTLQSVTQRTRLPIELFVKFITLSRSTPTDYCSQWCASNPESVFCRWCLCSHAIIIDLVNTKPNKIAREIHHTTNVIYYKSAMFHQTLRKSDNQVLFLFFKRFFFENDFHELNLSNSIRHIIIIWNIHSERAR